MAMVGGGVRLVRQIYRRAPRPTIVAARRVDAPSMRQTRPMLRAPRAAALGLAGVVLALSACADPAATMPIAVPSTKGTVVPTPTATGAGGGGTAGAGGVDAPRVHPAGAVAALVRGYDLPGLKRTADPASAVVGGCPGGPTITRTPGPTVTALRFTGTDGARADLVALTFTDVAAATAAVDPVLDADAACRGPAPAKGATTTVSKQRRDVSDGMPLGRVDLTRTSSAGTLQDYVATVQVGNVVLHLAWTGSDRTALNARASALLARLATTVKGL
ncbi:MAG: hypothetical protein JWP82_1262 [Humibacillus sp.]|nr:hypothetical protein [Humibacillus sp.]